MRKGRNREAKPSEMVGQIIITRPVESYVSFDRGNRVGICFSFLFFSFFIFYTLRTVCEISPKINTDNRSNDYAATRFPADFSHFCTDSAPVSRMRRETGSKRNRSFLQDNAGICYLKRCSALS